MHAHSALDALHLHQALRWCAAVQQQQKLPCLSRLAFVHRPACAGAVWCCVDCQTWIGHVRRVWVWVWVFAPPSFHQPLFLFVESTRHCFYLEGRSWCERVRGRCPPAMSNPVVWGTEDPMRLLLRFAPRRGAGRLWRCIVVLVFGCGWASLRGVLFV